MRRASHLRTNETLVDALRVSLKRSAWLRARGEPRTGCATRARRRHLKGGVTAAQGIVRSDEVEAVMRKVDRAHYASFNPYFDSPQSIGYNATISAPHMHALALELLLPALRSGASCGRALDVGAGSGYLTACLALLIGEGGLVIGIEHIPQLAELAERNLRRDQPALLRSGRVRIIVGDGRLGYPSAAPYDAIHVGAAAPKVPQELQDQLAPGGRMVVPVGDVGMQRLQLVHRSVDGTLRRSSKMLVSFVPLTEAKRQWSEVRLPPATPSPSLRHSPDDNDLREATERTTALIAAAATTSATFAIVNEEDADMEATRRRQSPAALVRRSRSSADRPSGVAFDMRRRDSFSGGNFSRRDSDTDTQEGGTQTRKEGGSAAYVRRDSSKR